MTLHSALGKNINFTRPSCIGTVFSNMEGLVLDYNFGRFK